MRQYSITNGPAESAVYRIGVKLEPDAGGGSSCLHETVREGDVLAISEPRNNFPLRRDANRTILLPGGIGITPLLAMAQALDRMGLAFELHCFAQSANHMAFRDVLDGLGELVVRHLDLSPDETVREIRRLVVEHEIFAHHLNPVARTSWRTSCDPAKCRANSKKPSTDTSSCPNRLGGPTSAQQRSSVRCRDGPSRSSTQTCTRRCQESCPVMLL